MIETSQEQTEVSARLRGMDYGSNLKACECTVWWHKNFFIGAQRVHETTCSSRFVWKIPEHVQMSFTSWGWFQPDCYLKREGCGVMTSLHNWHWNDVECGRRCCSICEIDFKTLATL